MTQIGADVDDLDHLGRVFLTSANRLDRSYNNVTSALRAVRWTGSDASGFAQSWSGSYGPTLRRAAVALRERSDALRKDAAEQREASNAMNVAAGAASGATSVDAANVLSPSKKSKPSLGPTLVSSTMIALEGAVSVGPDVGGRRSIRIDHYSDGSQVVTDLDQGSIGVGVGVTAEGHGFGNHVGGDISAGAKGVVGTSREHHISAGESLDAVLLAIAAKQVSGLIPVIGTTISSVTGLAAKIVGKGFEPEIETVFGGVSGDADGSLGSAGLSGSISSVIGQKVYPNGDIGFLYLSKESGEAWFPNTSGISGDVQVEAEVIVGKDGTRLHTITTYGSGDHRERIETMVREPEGLEQALDPRHPSRIVDVVIRAADNAEVRQTSYRVDDNAVGGGLSAGLVGKLGGSGEVSWSTMTMENSDGQHGASGSW